jgi:hypothetical protein
MTFEVQRVRLSDHSGMAVARTLHTALPFDVEVNDKPEPRGDYDSVCQCTEVFRLTDDAVAWLKRRGMFRMANSGRPNPVICRCMGIVKE